MKRTALLATTLVMALGLAAGCDQANFTAPERYERGLVICLSGAGGGMTGECQRIRRALDAGGVNRAIEIFDWSSGDMMTDQQDLAYNMGRAAELARHIEAYESAHPGQPVHLVALSAGTGVAVWSLEQLSGRFRVEGAMLLASSLDHHYDLSGALLHVRDHIYCFNSIADPVLAVGMPMSGTVDREGAVAGGLLGFQPPSGAPEATAALYQERLTQIGWTPADVVLGHLGEHLGATSPLYVQTKIVPLMLGREMVAEGPPGSVRPPPVAGKPVATKPVAAKADPAKSETAKTPDKTPAGPGGRFINWNIGAKPDAPRPPRPEDSAKPSTEGDVDESTFFRGPGGLP